MLAPPVLLPPLLHEILLDLLAPLPPQTLLHTPLGHLLLVPLRQPHLPLQTLPPLHIPFTLTRPRLCVTHHPLTTTINCM